VGRVMNRVGLKVFSTKRLILVIAALATALAMKAMSAHYGFSWAAALATG
jgi:hypothetical protein